MPVTKLVTFKETVLGGGVAGSLIIVDDACPVWGEMQRVVLHYPPNCNSLVDVAVGHNNTWALPSDVETYIALDDTTQGFDLTDEKVYKGERIWAKLRNRDGINSHTISVVITCVGEEEKEES